MTVESAADRAAFLPDFGVEVTWVGAAAAFLAIVERPSMTIESEGFTAPATARNPSLKCREVDLPSGAGEGDAVSVAGEGAFVCARVLPDGTGFCVVELKQG